LLENADPDALMADKAYDAWLNLRDALLLSGLLRCFARSFDIDAFLYFVIGSRGFGAR
jgi:hypothetical protein